MPITVTKSDGMIVIKKIGVSQDKYDWLMTSPFKVHVGSTGLTFHHPSVTAALETIPMTLMDVASAQANGLAPAKKKAFSLAIEEIIVKLSHHPLASQKPSGAMDILLKGAKPTAPPKTVGGEVGVQLATKDEIAAMAHSHAIAQTADVVLGFETKEDIFKPKIIEKEKIVSLPHSQDWPNYPFDQLWTGVSIKLRDAAEMYRPVTASSPDSRYFLVAGKPDLKIAARYQGGTLSLRAEGTGFANYLTQLKTAGLLVQGDYASVHLKCGTPHMASKALGAIIAGLGIPFATPIPQLNVFAKG